MSALSKKIELEEVAEKPQDIKKEVKVKKSRKPLGKVKYLLIGLAVFLLALVVFVPLFVVMPALDLKKDVQRLSVEGQEIYDALQSQDLNLAVEVRHRFGKAKGRFFSLARPKAASKSQRSA